MIGSRTQVRSEVHTCCKTLWIVICQNMVVTPPFNLREERDIENDSISLVSLVRVIILDFHMYSVINTRDARRARCSRV